jgi:membrane protease YdiL (CAAX protease family)
VTLTSNISKLLIARNLSAALIVVCLVIGGEYLFRHYVLFWLPTFGTLVVNDMLSLFLFYSLLTFGLGLIMHVNWRQELTGVLQAIHEGLSSWSFTAWILVLLLSIVVLSKADQLLWGKFELPMFTSSYRNPIVWLANFGFVLEPVSRLLVNGLFVPFAEEYLWRGIVQVRLLRIFPIPFAIGLTAVLFSLKHVLVDGSLGRFLTLIAFGAICGVVAQRSNWKKSAAMHIVINTMSTLTGLLFGLG